MGQNKYYGDTGMDSVALGGNSEVGGFLTSAVASGKALADDGQTYDTVQGAVDNASGIVIVGPGTFSEEIDITTSGLTLKGAGTDTVLDVSSSPVDISAPNVTVTDVKINPDSNNIAFRVNGSKATITRVESDGFFNTSNASTELIVTNSQFGGGVGLNGKRSIATGIKVTDGPFSVRDDDVIVANCMARDLDSTALYSLGDANDTILIGNQVLDSVDHSIAVYGSDCIVANNRVVDTANGALELDSTTVDDDNRTGSRN